MYCKKCGKELDDGTAFCPYCGQKQGEEIEESTPQKENHMSDKKIYAIGAVGAVVILAVIAIVKLVGRNNENNAAENSIVVNEDVNVTVEDIDGTKEVQKSTLDSTTVTEGASENTEKNSEDSNLDEAVNVQVASVKIGENEYWFDEDKDLIKAKTSRPEAIIFYSYFTDVNGNKVKYNQTMWSELLSAGYSPAGLLGGSIDYFNANGHLIKSIEYKSENGELLHSSEYSYDEENKLVKVNNMDIGYNWTEEMVIDYQKENNQMVISTHSYSESDNHSSKYTFVFNQDSKLSAYIEDVNANGEYVYTTEYTYDENGNLIREKDEVVGSVTEYSYDDIGNLVVSTSESNNNSYHSTGRIEYQYDENQNMIKSEDVSYSIYENGVTELGSDSSFQNKAVAANDHKQIVEYQYDDNGNMTSWHRSIESSNYDANGIVIQQSSHDTYEMREYDGDGKLIAYTYLDSNTGNDVTDDTSEYLYDEQGRLTEITLNGETAAIVNYTDAGMLQMVDFIIENGTLDWDVIYNLLPETEKNIMEDVESLVFLKNQDIIVEYR